MDRRNEFSESYYDHGCSIMHDRDVLDNDIIGKGCFLTFKRWWYNLFLLSYTDERARYFYSSSEAMRIERTRQFRQHRSSIHPLSKFRNFWDAFILFTLIANRITFEHNMSLIFDDTAPFMYYIGVVFEFILVLDLYINMKTGYMDHEARECVLDKKSSLIHYCATKVLGHAMGAIPLQSLLFLRYGKNVACGLCKSNIFHTVLVMLNVLSLYRMYDASSYWTRKRKSNKATYFFRFLRVCGLGLVIMQHILNLNDAITLYLFIETQKIDEYAYYAVSLKANTFGYSDTMMVCIDFMKTCKSLFLFGFGPTLNRFYLDRMTCVFAYFIGNAFFMSFVLETYNYVSRLSYPNNQLLINKRRTINILRCRQLPDKIRSKICQYYNFNMIKFKVIENQNGLYKLLPSTLTREIALNSNMRYIMRIPYFSEWPIPMLEHLTLMLKEEIYLENDVIAEAWTQGEGLFIIDAGVMAIFSIRNEETGHLIDGDYFGELSLVTDREVRLSYVVAITPCKALVLLKSDFRRYMRDYSDMFFALKRHLREKYKQPEE